MSTGTAVSTGDIITAAKMNLKLEDYDLVDDEELLFGTGDDVVVKWNGSKLTVIPATDDTGSIEVGNGTKDIDIKVFLGSTDEYVEFNVGDSKVNMVGTASTVLTVTSTITAADSSLEIITTDSGTPSSGYSRGLYVSYTQSGAKTGTAEVNPIGCDLTVSANVAHAFNVSLYNAVSGSPTIDYFSGIYLYFDATGSATVNRKYGIQLEIDNTNEATEDGFIYLYRHGSHNLDSCIRMETAAGTADYFIKNQSLSASPFESGDITDGKSCIGGIRCIAGATVGVIPLYED